MPISPEQAAALAAPFDPADVDFRPLEGNQVAAYVDARVVSARLNDVLGVGGWDWICEPLVISPGVARRKGGEAPPHDVVWLVKGILTIGGVSKSDIGEGDANETSKTAFSDALKRAAVHFGVGAYLYSLPRQTARVENYQIPPDELKRLRAALPRPQSALGRAVVAQETQQGSEATTSTDPAAITEQQQQSIRAAVGRAGMTMDELLNQLDITALTDLSHDKAGKVIDRLNKRAHERQARAAQAAPDPNSPVADTPRLTAVR